MAVTSIQDVGYDEYQHTITITTASDGTHTIAQVLNEDGDVIGQGESRRRKGDTRNQLIGDSLALARAFGEASNTLFRVSADEGGHGLPEELSARIVELATKWGFEAVTA